MQETIDKIIARINELIEEEDGYGRQVAHDLVDQLTEKMEKLASERVELEDKLKLAAQSPDERSTLVNEVASRLEKTAGRARFTKNLIDSIIEKLYNLTDEEVKKLSETVYNK